MSNGATRPFQTPLLAVVSYKSPPLFVHFHLSHTAPCHSPLQFSPPLGPYLPEVSEQTQVLYLFWKLLELFLKCLDVCIHGLHPESTHTRTDSLSQTRNDIWQQVTVLVKTHTQHCDNKLHSKKTSNHKDRPRANRLTVERSVFCWTDVLYIFGHGVSRRMISLLPPSSSW